LLGQVNSENYVRITRELAELNPLIDAVKAYRAANAELAGIDALIADLATESDMRGMAEAERETLQARSVELAQQIRAALLPKDAGQRNVVLGSRRQRRSRAVRGDLFRCMSASELAGLEGRGDLRQRRHHGGSRKSSPGAGPWRVSK
jgi:peptide chain release factor 1